MKKKYIASMAALAAFTLVVVAWFLLGNNGNAVLETARAATGDITESVNATGRVTPVLSVSIGTQVTGTIKKIHVDYNDRVKKGQLLIELDREVYAARLSEAESELDARRAEMERAKAEFDREDADFRRREELFNAGYISKNEYEAAAYGQAARKASLELAGAQLRRAGAALDIARENLQKTIIRSPVDGIVLSRDVEEGQTVSANLQAPTLLTVADLARMQVHALVDEADIGKARAGQKAGFYVDSFPEKEFEGSVSKIYYSPTIEQNVVTYNVIIDVDNTGLLLRPGMTATVKLIVSEKKDVLTIPNRALRVRIAARGADGSGGPRVWVVRAGKAVSRPVKTGLRDEENTEVVEGLAEGEEVLLSAPENEKSKRRGLRFRWFH